MVNKSKVKAFLCVGVYLDYRGRFTYQISFVHQRRRCYLSIKKYHMFQAASLYASVAMLFQPFWSSDFASVDFFLFLKIKTALI